MCGRTGLNLCAADVQCACVYKRKDKDELHKPEWVEEYNFDKEYKPSYNIAPTEVTPVLVSAANFGMGESDEQILKPMMWGMVPPWHKEQSTSMHEAMYECRRIKSSMSGQKSLALYPVCLPLRRHGVMGTYKNHNLSTNNCRLEGISSSRLYGSALRKGNRCVVLAEGFYEWQTANASKQPYYIYFNQDEGIKVEDPSSWVSGTPRLLYMAGLYEEWSPQTGDDEEGNLYAYSVLTLESGTSFSWLHHRVPAILSTDQQVADWLDVERVPSSSATSMFSSSPPLSWHPVSSLVNNSRNKSPDCNKPAPPTLRPAPPGSRSLMEAWLRKPDQKEPQCKKQKKDN